MIRKLAFALSLLGAMIAESVFALGIGEATVKSALNQPLKAEIELVNAGGLSAEEVLPGLATREEFLRANVDRVYFLSDIRFKVETNSEGKLVVILTSNKPVREPFLNFLVEVIWPSGRLLREYALLIDPPLFSEEPAAPVRAPSISAPVSQTGDVVNVPKPAPVSRRSVANPSPRITGGEYGPTDSKDTLWDIALKARPDRSVSPQQVMLAILDLNPGAFINGNINKMKAGQVLRLPTMDQIKQRSGHQAIEEVIAQNESARGKRTKSVASSKATAPVVPSSTSSTGDELKLVVAKESSQAASGADSGSSASGQGSGKESDPQIAITLEKLDKANIENKELNSRVTDLEEQLQTLQRLLTLKNDQLANIQTQMRANELEKARTIQAQAEAKAVVADESMSSTNVVQSESEEVDSSPQIEAPVVSKVETDTPAVVKEVAVEETTVATPVSKPTSQDQESAPIKDTKSDKTDKNIVEVIVGNTLYLAIAIVVILVVVGLLWLVSRNNAKREEEFQAMHGAELDSVDIQDIADEELTNEGAEQGLEGDAFEPSDVLGEEEYIDEDISSNSDEQTGGDEDGDVIAEADVYIAYGRLDQAAAVLESAISQDPVRTDLRLKLLEVYKQSGDAEAFNRQFSELEAIQDPASIEQANLLRADMLDEQLVSIEDKEHELELSREFQEVESAQRVEESSIETEAEALEEESQSFDFDSVELDNNEEVALDESLDAELDASLGEDGLLGEGSESGVELDTGLDLSDELSDIDSELGSSELDSSEQGIGEAADDIASELASAEDFDDSILDVDLDDIDLSGELDQETEIQLPSDLADSAIVESLAGEESVAEDLSATDQTEKPVISDDILEQAAEKLESDDSTLDEGLADSGDFDFLEGTDESSTKLDLARAYIDMGDIEGAKDILEEVVKEGNSDQQSEASELLNSLDS